MKQTILFDDLSHRSSLTTDEIIFLVDSRVLSTSEDESDLVFDSDAFEKLEVVEKLKELGYSMEQSVKIMRNVGEPVKRTRNIDSANQKQQLYTPGQLAKHFNVSPRAIKYWEEKKLIKPFTRSRTGIRFYHKKTMVEIMLLKGFQDLGFSLGEIKVFLDLWNFILDPSKHSDQENKIQMFFRRLDELDAKLKANQESINTLKRLSQKGRSRLQLITNTQS